MTSYRSLGSMAHETDKQWAETMKEATIQFINKAETADDIVGVLYTRLFQTGINQGKCYERCQLLSGVPETVKINVFKTRSSIGTILP